MLVLMLLVISAVSQCQAWGYSIFVIHFDCHPHTDFTLFEQISAAHELQQKSGGCCAPRGSSSDGGRNPAVILRLASCRHLLMRLPVPSSLAHILPLRCHSHVTTDSLAGLIQLHTLEDTIEYSWAHPTAQLGGSDRTQTGGAVLGFEVT